MASLLDRPPSALGILATSLVASAPGSHARYTRTGLTRTAQGANAKYHAHVDLAGFGPLDWDGTLALTRVTTGKKTDWRVIWRPDDLYPGLAAGQLLTLERSWPAREVITASDGSLLAGPTAIVTIGLEPRTVTATLPRIKKLLKTLVGTDPATIDAALHGPGVRPNYFVPVATVPDDEHFRAVVRPVLLPVSGVFFHHDRTTLTASALLTGQLLGTVGPITSEQLHALGPPYRMGDDVGSSGLEAAYENRLAGSPTGTVVIGAGNRIVRTVATYPGRAPQAVRLTIDPTVQRAAETALAGETLPAALVAIDAPTGRVRAVVSKPDNGPERAIAGSYAPGSTFGVVTSTALLAAGHTASTPASCPPALTVDGVTFRNAEPGGTGVTDLAEAFRHSCSTAFAGLANQLSAKSLAQAASSYGFGARSALPIPSQGGTFPNAEKRSDLAATATGQGGVLASPVEMASVAATVAAGQWHAPVLSTQPEPVAGLGPPLDPRVLGTLRSFMASVAQPGGGASGAGFPTGVAGAAGSADVADAHPARTDAWFIGYRGDLAFAVIVEGGGSGVRAAAPLAAKFLGVLARS